MNKDTLLQNIIDCFKEYDEQRIHIQKLEAERDKLKEEVERFPAETRATYNLAVSVERAFNKESVEKLEAQLQATREAFWIYHRTGTYDDPSDKITLKIPKNLHYAAKAVFEDKDYATESATDKERCYWEDYIKCEAERAGIDTRGIVGGAILHTMVDEITHLKAVLRDKD